MKQRTMKFAPPAAVSLERAKPEWLPLHVASLRFFPAYAATAKTFGREIAQLVKRFNSTDDFKVLELEPYVIRIAFDGVGLVIDAAKGDIELEADVVDDEWETIFSDYDFGGIRARANHFPRNLPEGNIKPQFRGAARQLHQLALRLIASWTANFQHAVTVGGAEIFGRWRDLQSPFQPIHVDQWQRLEALSGAELSPGTDVSTIAADGGRGELTIFSIHVCPHRIQESASNAARRECLEFLTNKMNGSPVRIPVETLESEAREHWSEKQLPHRTFVKCYRDVKSTIKSPGWHTRGPVPSLVQRTG
jgi:hypothetical protein